ncbi:MAG TPA: Gfo/Idh/MocA family oxidoreductase [Limnochordia bacterium]|nr:Gfo/Idh/MocA family oxidoreductase [Limnochordia bacterium]
MPGERLKIALIGAGRRGRGSHLPVLRALNDVYELVAVCDRDPEVAQAVAAECGIRGYTDLRELIARERLDAADVVVPVDGHHAVCALLARAGVHVLVETPIAATRRLADLMIAEAAKANTVLEVAENYYRMPSERFVSRLIEAGWIGEVSRIHRIFHEGGYHGMSLLRLRAGAPPASILGIRHSTAVRPHTDRMLRRHECEEWSFAAVTFTNGVMALMAYSNVVHARSLGRGQTGIMQIDGSEGTIVGDTVHRVPADAWESGARAEAFTPRRRTRAVGGVEVLETIELEAGGETVAWENPLARYPLREGQVSVADELLSLADAVRRAGAPEYGAAAGRLDQEMAIGMSESGRRSGETLTFPLPDPLAAEQAIEARIRRETGCEPDDIERLVDVFFPRR